MAAGTIADTGTGGRAHRLSLSRKLGLALFLTVVLVGGSILGAASWIFTADAQRRAQDAIETNMRVAWSEVDHIGTDFRLENGHLMAGGTALNGLNAVTDKISALVGGNATIFMGDVRVATSIRKADGSRAVGTLLAKNAAYRAVFSGHKYRGEIGILGARYIAGYDPIEDASGKVVGILFVGIPLDQFYAALHRTTVWCSAIGVLAGLVVLAGVLFFVRRKLVRPLSQMTRAMGSLAAGDLGVTIPAVGAGDEVGDMGEALRKFRDNAHEMERMKLRQQETEQQAEAARRRMLAEMAQGLEASVGGVVAAIGSSAAELQASAQTMSAIARETQQQSAAVAGAAQQTTANVQIVAAATEELTASGREIGHQVTKASRMAGDAVAEAGRTGVAVDGLEQAVQKIGDVVGLIRQIAGQTNLLALNATIEAARAGEAGRGFAVVASEVKSLASQTAQATEEIAAQIAEIQGATGSTVSAIRTIGGSIEEINDVASAVAAAVQQQVAATGEISGNVQQAAQGTENISHNIGEVADAATRTGSAATTVLTVAEALGRQAASLHGEVDRFLAVLKPA